MRTFLLLFALSLVHFSGLAQCAITTQPLAPSPVCSNGIGTAPSLSVTATGTNLSYQWYSNTTSSNSGGTIAPGQSTSAVYTPPVAGAGTTYYYVVVIGDCGTITSNAVPVSVVTGVSIQTQPTLPPQQICVGGTVPALTVVASGVNLSYQWYSNSSASFSFNTSTAITGANGPSYTPSSVISGTIFYYVTVTGGCGSPLTINSNPVQVTINAGSGTAITTQPVAPAPECESIAPQVLTVAATGSSLSYTWFKNTVNSNSGGTPVGSGSTFTAPGIPGTIYYYVTVQGSCGSATSNAVPVIDQTQISAQPSGPTNICVNGAGPLLSATVPSGSGTAGLVFQWYSNTANSNSGGTAISGATALTYTPPTSAAGTRYYYVTATGYCNAAVSNVVPVTVNAGLGTSITSQPAAATTVCVNGIQPVLAVGASGTNLTYQWWRNGSNSNSGGTPINAATGNSYPAPVSSAGATWYYVIVTGSCGIATSRAALVSVVNATAITTQPAAPAQVCANGTAPALSVAASGFNLVYQWYRNTTNSNSGGNAIAGANGPAYTPILTAAGTSSFYYVTVTGDCGTPVSVTSNAVQISVVAATAITTQPTSFSGSVCINTNGLQPFFLNATGTGTLIYQWYNSVTNSNSGGNAIIGATSPSYAPQNIAGTVYYYATATSACGIATSNTASVTETGGPTIFTQPMAAPSVCANGAPEELTVGASGTNLSYQWYSNTVNSNTGGATINGANSNSYIVPVTISGTTWYYVNVSNNCASVVSNAVPVNVIGGTAITTQPVSPAPVCTNGQPPVLSVTASGTGLSYQWFSNANNDNNSGNAISGATGQTYTVPVNAAGTTYYYVTVTGSCGSPLSVTSNAVEVDVNPGTGTAITSQPVPATVCPETAAPVLAVAATGDNLAYQWYSNTTNNNTGGTMINGANGNDYAPPVGSMGTTWYYVVVTGDCGIVASNAVNITVSTTGTNITSQPVAPSPVCWNGVGGAPSLSVTATGTNLSYQWYSNTTSSNSGGTLAPGQSASAVYAPPISGAGMVYYYAVVTGDCGTMTSNAVPVTVVTGVSILTQPAFPNQPICVGGTAPALTVVASGANLSYQWYSNSNASFSYNTSTAITGANGPAYTPASIATGITVYYVSVTGGCGSPSAVNSNPVIVPINPGSGTAIITQPVAPAPDCIPGSSPSPILTVAATGSNLSYAWFRNTTNSNSGGTEVASGLSPNFVAQVSSGTNYYYVTVHGSCGSVTSNAVPVIGIIGQVQINAQFAGPTNICVNSAGPLFSATVPPGSTAGISFQWFSNTVIGNGVNGPAGTAISGATASTYAPPTNATGTIYYYVMATSYCNVSVSNPLPVTVSGGPATSITSQPAAATTVCVNGTPPTLTVAASGTNLAYQWYTNGSNSNSGGTLINGATGNTVTPPFSSAGTTWYFVIVTGSCGSVTSNAVVVNVVNGTTITTQPAAPAPVCSNGAAPTLSVVASGSNLVFQWYSNSTNSNSGGNAIAGANGAIYTPIVTAVGSSVYYYVTVTGDCGTPLFVTSNPALVSVVGPPTISGPPSEPPFICTPSNGSVQVQLAFGVFTNRNPAFQWYSSATNTYTGGTPVASSNGAPSSNQLFLTLSTAGTTYYYLTVDDYCGTVTGAPVPVTISTPPVITAQPVPPPAVCVNGQAQLLSVSATGSEVGFPLNYQWYINTANSNNGGTAIGGATGSFYAPPALVPGIYYYYVVIGNLCGTVTSNVVSLNVIGGTSITAQPVAPPVICSTTSSMPSLSVAAQGIGVSYQWYSNSSNSNSGGTLISGATGATFTPALSNIAGTTYYYAIATGNCGSPLSVTSNAVPVTIISGTSIISQQDALLPVCANGTFSPLSVQASGSDLVYQWYSNTVNSNTGGSLVSGATGATFTPPPSNAAGTTYYYAMVTGDCGSPLQATSNAVAATVIGGTVITSQPVAPPVVCTNGTPFQLGVSATGDNLQYQWYSNTANNNTGGTQVSGATGAIFGPDISAAGTMYYYVVITGDCGSPQIVSSNAVPVTVISGTTITVQPLAPPAICINGTIAPLTVSASGENLQYQWYSNSSNSNSGGSPIDEQTASAFTPPVLTAGTTWYYVVVTGDCGTPSAVTSNAVAVTVNAQTTITMQPVSPEPVCQNGTSPIVTVTATGINQYQWYSNATASNSGGSPIDGQLANSFAAPVGTPGTFYYYVIVTGDCSGAPASVTSDVVTVVVNAGNGTAITTQPLTPPELCVNGTAPVLSVTATGANSYQWYVSPTSNTAGGLLIEGAIVSTYSPPVSTAGTNWYFVVVSGDCGAATSNAVAVNVVSGTSITTQPVQPAQVCVNDPTPPILTVTAIGANLSYQWYANTVNSNTGGSSISTASGNSYTPPVNAVGSTWYYVIVTGDCGAATSNAVEITVVSGTAITTQPVSPAAVCTGGTISPLTVSATGVSLTYQWYSNSINSNTGGSPIGGANSSTYLPDVTGAGTTYYYVTVTGTCGTPLSATSNAVAVIVSGGTVITSQPVSQSGICVGGVVNPLQVSAIGGTLSYQWYSNSTNSNSGGTAIGGAAGSNYPPSSAATGYYYVAVTGTCGVPFTVNSNAAAIIINNATAITLQPSSPAPVCVNGTAPTLTVAASGGDLSYQWYSNTSNTNSGGVSIPGAIGAGYQPSLSAAGTYYYYVIVTGDCGTSVSVTSNVVTVIVRNGTSIVSQPVQPGNACIGDGSIMLSVTASGANTYQWYSNTVNSNTGGQPIANTNSDSYAPSTAMAGTVYYYVVVAGDCGTVTSNAVAATVNPLVVINTQPVSPAAVCINGTLPALSVTAGGSNLSYQWYANSTNSNSGGTTIDGAINNSYTPPSNIADTMYYYVIVSGDCGALVTSAVTVIVNPATAITVQPVAPASLCPNDPISALSVTATGINLGYQWYSNSTNSNSNGAQIANANSITYTPPVSTAGTVYYYVVVTGGCGSVTSNPVAVVVNAATQILTQPVTPDAVCLNADAPSLAVSASGTDLAFHWYSNLTNSNTGGTLITDATGSVYAPPVNAVGTIYYYVIVSGTCGSLNSNAVAVVVNSGTAITVQPVAPPAAVCPNGTIAALNVTATGPNLSYAWYSNSANSNSGGTQIVNTNTNTYAPPVSAAGTVYYYVVVTGSCGIVPSNAVAVTVSTPTAISVQPVAPLSAVCPNGSISPLSVSATGTNLSYAWYSNSANSNSSGTQIINANTNTYVPPVSSAGTIYYYVVLTGSCGIVPSNAVAVTVSTPTAISVQPVAPLSAVCPNGSISALSVSATGANLNYAWYSNSANNNTSGTQIINANTNTYAPPVSVAGTVYYYVVVTGSCGIVPSDAVAVTVSTPTAISIQPVAPLSSVCPNGTIAALSVTATGTNLSYSWYSNSANSNSGGTQIINTNTDTYAPPVSAAGPVYYYVVVTGDCGVVPSNAVAVTVSTPTAISIQPVAPLSSVCPNGTIAALSVTATGTNLSYSWYSNSANSNSGGTQIINANTDTYAPPVSAAGTVYYYVVVTGSCGIVPSNAVAVTVSTPTAIAVQPVAPSGTVCPNGSISALSVSATGTNLSYAWYSNSANSNSGGTQIINANTDTYAPPVSAAGTVYYYVVVTGDCGIVPSNMVAVTVSTPTAISVQPVAPLAAVCPNGPISALSVSATGTNLSYTWYSNSTNSNSGGTQIINANTNTYAPPVSTAGTVYYYVVVRRDCGIVPSNAVAVTVSTPTAITVQPIAPLAAICPNGSISALSISATGTNLSYAWYSNSANSNSGGTQIINANVNTYAPPVNTAGTVYYYVVVTGSCGIVPSNAVAVTVSTPTAINVQPVAPLSAVCPNGSISALSVSATGTNLSYAWYSNSTNSNRGGTQIINTNNNTYAPPVSAAGTVYYYVVVTGDCGIVPSNAVAVTVSTPTAINVQPVAPASICQNGTSTSLGVAATGTNLTYLWYSNSTNSNSGGTPIATATAATFTVPSGATGTFYYYVTVTGSCGGVTSNAVSITVSAGTAITKQPVAPAAVCAGGVAPTISVTASGTGTLTYLWYNNTTNSNSGGSPIATATGTSYTAPVSTAGTTWYYVIVTGNCGPIASNAVAVTVNALPNAIITAAASVCAVTTGNIASVANAGSGAVYAWTITNGTITAGSTTNSITYTSGASGSVTLSVTVTNSSGCKASSGSKSVSIMAFPNATITVASSVCGLSTGNTATIVNAGTGGTYAWVITNGTITSGASTGTITFTAGSSGSVTLLAVVINSIGCKLSLGAKSVPINPSPSTAITASTSVCSGSTANTATVASAGSGASYTWAISNGNITSGSGTNSIKYTTGVLGSVTLSVVVTSGGCSASSGNKLVTITALPVPTITAPASVCSGSTANAASVASAGSGASYAWTISNGTITSGSGTNSIKFTAATSGSVTLAVTVTNSTGCKASSGNILVPITSKVTPTFAAIATLCQNATPPALPTTSTNAISGTWNPSKITTTATGTKTYTFTPASGACATSISISVVVQKCATKASDLLPSKLPEIQTTTLDAVVFPNPSQSSFTLLIKGNRKEVAEIRVFDAIGRSLDHMRAATGGTVQFGAKYVQGLYFVEVLQGTDRKILKALKQ